ncbi:MAG: endonuclease [Prevotella sp.]|nr:endonuclease [Prevotella sp.]
MTKEFLSKGRQRYLMLVSFLLLAVATFAVPAKPGLTRLLTLTDGSTVNATLVGDEYLHYWLGADGNAYQAVGEDTYQSFDPQANQEAADERRSSANHQRARRLAPRKVGNVGSITGQKKGLIILVNFSDVSFKTANNKALYKRIANEENFTYTINSSYSFKGSMRDYFYVQSDGKFELTFDVVGPVTVSKTQAYYGANDSKGNDEHPAEMVIEALNLANSEVNYANYDWDGDGYVEQVYVVYAGKGEADGGAANTIWPHEWTLSSANYYGDGTGRQQLDGKYIDTYACGGELNGSSGNIAGIGTMCHEFSHCLGYPDFYDTKNGGGQGMGYWDLMDSGSYNDDGYQPAGYTSYERMVAGWKTPEELVYTQNISNMTALQDEGSKSYIIYNKGHRDEYYLLENRQMKKWDTSLPGAGLLILHVDYNSSAWSNNTVNNTLSNQRMTWIPADNQYQYTTYQGTKYYTFEGMANDPFPYGSVNAFGKNTTPAATLYNKNSDDSYYLDSSIENITQNSDGTISFYFRGISNVALPVISPDAGRFAKDQTVTVTITAETGAAIYYTTNGDTPTAASTLYTAPFTLNATTTVKAIAVKDDEESGIATATYTFIDPLILADESLSFTAQVGSSETKQLTVLTEGLTQDVTLALTDANGVFSLSPATISKSQEEATVNVTFSPTAAGNYSGTITLTSEGAAPVTVSLTGTAPVTVPELTVSNVTATDALATWTACDGVSSYTLQLASDDQFTTGGSSSPSATQILSEDFSGFTSTSTADISNSLNNYTATTGWNGSKVYPENEMAKIGASSGQGWIMTPALNASGTLTVVWSAYRYGTSDKSTILLGISENGTDFYEETITIGDEIDTFTNTFTVSSSTVYVRWMASASSKARFYLDDITISTGGSGGGFGSGSLIAEYTVTDGTSYTFTGLTPYTIYYARVKGNADWSNIEEFLTEEAPVTNTAPTWSSTFPATASINVGQTYTLANVSSYVSGSPAPTITLNAPAGLEAELEDDTFTFIPESSGDYTFTFTATNGISPDATATLTLNVSSAQTSSYNEFALVTSATDFVEGDYIIVYDGGAMNTTVSSNRLLCTEVTPTNNVITTDNAAIIWHIAPSGDYYTIYNARENKYAAATGSNNQAQLSSSTDDKSLWSVTTGTTGSTFEFINKSNSRYLRRNGTYGFACYASGTGGALSLYKRTSGSIDPAIAYYQNADGKKGSELKTAMSSIILPHTQKTYDYLWTAFQTTDVRNDGKIWDMYSNATNYEPANKGETYTKEGDCYNREHSFPKSWFGGEVTPMFTDLHHIYPTDGYINGRRSNYPFGETNGGTYQSANNFSKLGTCTYPGYTGIVFEPADEYKGDFARTYFYMVTCYENELSTWRTNYSSTEVQYVLDGNTYPGLTEWQLNMLMKWAKNDPVSEKETARNNAVYAIQNNRNPFIDYPGLEEYVWGSLTAKAFSYDNYEQPTYKQDVAMSFSPVEATAIVGEDFTEPTLTTNPAGLTVTYSSSVPSVATVNSSTGEVTLVAAGTTTITASFAGNDSYNEGSASYTLTVSNPALAFGETLLYEGLSKYSGSDASQAMETTYQYLDYKGWSSITSVFAGGKSNAQRNGGCLKFGSGSAAGSMTTSSITLTNGGTLTFYLKKYSSDEGKLKVTVEGYTEEEFTPTSDWTLCTVDLSEVSGNVTITLATTKNRAYVDEIKLTSNGTLNLANDGGNATNIAAAAANGGKFNVKLKDRTLYEDGNWNTLCLPFDCDLLSIMDFGLTVMAFDADNSTFDNGTLTLNFTTVYDGIDNNGTLVAGTPYIVKWPGYEGHTAIIEPVFYGVTINAIANNTVCDLGDGKSIAFCGTYEQLTYDAADQSVLFLGNENTLYYPESGAAIGAQRAYFKLEGLEAKASAPGNGGSPVRQFILNFNTNDVEGIIEIANSHESNQIVTDWYDLSGRKIDNAGTAVSLPKGIYIHNGRKIVVK